MDKVKTIAVMSIIIAVHTMCQAGTEVLYIWLTQLPSPMVNQLGKYCCHLHFIAEEPQGQ